MHSEATKATSELARARRRLENRELEHQREAVRFNENLRQRDRLVAQCVPATRSLFAP